MGVTFVLLGTWTTETRSVVGTTEPLPGRGKSHQVLHKSEGKRGYKTKQFELDSGTRFCLGTIEQEVHPDSKKVIWQ